MTASQQQNFSLTNNTTQMAMDSQMTFDPDATLDIDATQPDPFEGLDEQKITNGGDNSILGASSTSATLANGVFQTNLTEQQNDALSTSAAQQHTSQASSLYTNACRGPISSTLSSTRNNLEWDNAVSAAMIIIDLIEKKGAKRIIEKYEQGQKGRELDDSNDQTLETIDPWVTCHGILVPGNQKPSSTAPASSSSTSSTPNAHNVYIQKLLLLVERLTDRDLERRLAVHMKYHELEDEGTARAMPSAGLMGLVYHMVQIRPVLDDEDLVNRLVKLQAIKGSFDESFYLELWFAALTGLREASFNTSCQNNMMPKNTTDTEKLNVCGSNTCNTTVATNRLLWKNLVLVKLPHLINLLQKRKETEELANYSLKRDAHQKSSSVKAVESNAIESSLMELRTFTGLLNACSPPACCSEFYVPSSKSSNLVNQFAFGGANGGQQQLSSTMEDDDDDSMMHMIDDMSYAAPTDFNTPTFIKAIRSISTDDIFTCIIYSCQPYKFLRESKLDKLLNKTGTNGTNTTTNTSNHIKSEQYDNADDTDFLMTNGSKQENGYPSSSSSSLFDDDHKMVDADDSDQHDDIGGKPDNLAQIEQNIDERMNAIQTNLTRASISELIHIGLVSLIYWQKIVDFILKLLQEKAQAGDVRSLSRICDALDDCPSAIDLILQLYHPSVLLSPLESICNEWNPSEDYMDMDDGASGSNENEEDDDDDMDGIQNWYFKFGKIWTFVLVVGNKFDIARNIDAVFKNKSGLCCQFFITGPVIYGAHAHDQEVEDLVGRWLSAMGGDGISDDLLRTTNLQLLLRATPTIIDRLLCIYDSGRIDMETFTGVLSYFRRRFLRFVLVPGVTEVLCDELLSRNASTALTCMSHLFLNQSLSDTLIGLCGNTILGSLRAWMECQRQYRKWTGNKNRNNISDIQQQHQIPNEDDNQANSLEQFFINKLDLDDEQHLSVPETISSGITRRTLFEKAREMFRYIVKSGRSMYMNDVDKDAKTLWEPVANSKPPKQVVSHYLDLIMFQAALKMGGAHWFIGMIVDEVLEAGKSGGAVRAAELGSCLLTTPLTCNAHGESACLAMFRCLLQDVIPSSINYCSTRNTSFFQGQTLGVFTSDCLVLMYHEAGDLVDELGDNFFKALVIDRVRGGDVSSLQMVPQASEDGTRFAPWDEEVVGSPVWRGFVKGLMSNPFIKEMWPGAYAS
ncbi:unnamed protein product [Absidia cylindrospora]